VNVVEGMKGVRDYGDGRRIEFLNRTGYLWRSEISERSFMPASYAGAGAVRGADFVSDKPAATWYTD
jgi:hypothetical protein